MPDAHPSAWPAGGQPAAGRSRTDWAGARTGGDPAREDIWWRGERDIWWRVPDLLAGDADSGDDIDGLGELSEVADGDDLTDGAGPADADAEAGGAEADTTGEGRGQGGGRPAGSARRAPGSAGRAHGQRDGSPGGAGGPRGAEHEAYQPWFSPAVSGDPWFAAGRQYRTGG